MRPAPPIAKCDKCGIVKDDIQFPCVGILTCNICLSSANEETTLTIPTRLYTPDGYTGWTITHAEMKDRFMHLEASIPRPDGMTLHANIRIPDEVLKTILDEVVV